MAATDFADFLAWYTARHLRKKGSPPAASTLHTKQVYLRMAARKAGAAGPDAERILCELLTDRDRMNSLLDTMCLDVKPQTLRQVVYALLPLAEYGRVKWGLVPALTRADLPGPGDPKPITVYTPVEMERFVALAEGQSLRWWALLAFLSHTGRRVGEALGLEWDWYRPFGATTYFELPTTKNKDPQYVPLDIFLKDTVFRVDNIERMKNERRARGWGRSPELFVFPWRYSTAHGMFGRFCLKHGLPNRGFHNFRHTVITNRIARGVPIQAVASLAGHRSAAVTLNRYNHASALAYARYLEN